MFQVTVAKKLPSHSAYNKGSRAAYLINNQPDYTFNLVRGKTYKFNINAPNHPFYFTTDPTGGQGDKDSLMGPDEPVTDQGTTTFNVRDDLPDAFYYQCQNHPNMGGKVILRSSKSDPKLDAGWLKQYLLL